MPGGEGLKAALGTHGRAAAAWLLILALAILNGALREALLVPQLGKPAAYTVSGLLLSLLILAVALALASWLQLARRRQAFFVGALWLVLTLVFEFGFDALQGQSWREMLAAYTLRDGNIWPLVLLVTFIAPFLAAWVRLGTRWR